MYTYVCVCICVRIYIYVNINECMDMGLYVCVFVCMNVFGHLYLIMKVYECKYFTKEGKNIIH